MSELSHVTRACVTDSLIHAPHVSLTMCHIYETCIIYMGWLRLVGSFKLYVSFAEYTLFYRALLQKRGF